MKTIKLTAVLAAVALTGTAVFAGDLAATTVTNAKGQPVALYRVNETAIAVYAGGRGAGTSNNTGELKTVSLPNNKGQAIALYWAD
jgi:type IV secretory pathway protease TraF